MITRRKAREKWANLEITRQFESNGGLQALTHQLVVDLTVGN